MTDCPLQSTKVAYLRVSQIQAIIPWRLEEIYVYQNSSETLKLLVISEETFSRGSQRWEKLSSNSNMVAFVEHNGYKQK